MREKEQNLTSYEKSDSEDWHLTVRERMDIDPVVYRRKTVRRFEAEEGIFWTLFGIVVMIVAVTIMLTK